MNVKPSRHEVPTHVANLWALPARIKEQYERREAKTIEKIVVDRRRATH